MSKEVEEQLLKIPILNWIVKFGKKIKIPILEGMSLYDVLELYVIGIIKGALTSRAGGIAFSFFMAIFPFFLFILTLISYIPIDGFQGELFTFIRGVLPPKTFEAVQVVLGDIINNQYGGLLSFGFILSRFTKRFLKIFMYDEPLKNNGGTFLNRIKFTRRLFRLL